VTGYWLDDRGSIPARGRRCHRHRVQTGCGTHPATLRWLRRLRKAARGGSRPL